MSRKIQSQTAAGLAVIAAMALSANAQEMYFDFGGNFGTEAGMITSNPDVNGNTWNNMSGPFIANTVDTSGNLSGIGIGFVSNYGANGGIAGGGLFAPSPVLLVDFAIETVTQDFYYGTPLDPNIPFLSFDMWGYDDADTVTFRFFGSHSDFEDMETTYTAHGGNGSFSGTVMTSGLFIGEGGLLDQNDNTIVEISGVSSSGGLINIEVTPTLGNFCYINGMTVEVVPASSCPPDLNGDGIVDNGDIAAFITLFLAGDLAVDFNGDGLLDNGDITGFINAFLAGC